MVFFTMVPPSPKPKTIKKSRTLKRRKDQKPVGKPNHTIRLKVNKRPKVVKHHRPMKGGSDCDVTGLVTEPGLNIPSLLSGNNSGLNISKKIARIEQQSKK